MTLYLIEAKNHSIIKVENTLVEAEAKKKELKEKNSSLDFQIRKIQSELFEKEVNRLKFAINNMKEKFFDELSEILIELANEKIEIKIDHYSKNAISIMVYLGNHRVLLKYVFNDENINCSLDKKTIIICPMSMGNHSQYTDNGYYKKIDILIGKIWEHQNEIENIFKYIDNGYFNIYYNYLEVLDFIKILEQVNTKKGER